MRCFLRLIALHSGAAEHTARTANAKQLDSSTVLASVRHDGEEVDKTGSVRDGFAGHESFLL